MATVSTPSVWVSSLPGVQSLAEATVEPVSSSELLPQAEASRASATARRRATGSRDERTRATLFLKDCASNDPVAESA